MSMRPYGQIPAYDPFGEAVEAAGPCPGANSDRRLRNAAVAVFWMLALLLTAGRIYLGDHGARLPIAHGATPAIAEQQVASAR